MTNVDWRALALGAAPASSAAEEPDPALGLTLDTALDGGDPHNHCLLVGTVVREERRRARGSVNALGASVAPLQIEVDEAGSDPYRLRLTVGARLLARYADLLTDGARVVLSGALRLERGYDRRFAQDDLDAGLAQWELRLDVLDVRAASDADGDGTWVRLQGEVADAPRVHARPNGEWSVAHVAATRLHDRRAAHGAFAHSRAVRPISSVLPIEVALAGVIDGAGALLRSGNRVRVEGRLAPAAYRRRLDPAMEAALQRQAERVRAQGGPDLERRVASAQRRLLMATRVAVEVGYVELLHGTPLDDAGIDALIADHERARRARRAARGLYPLDAPPDDAAPEAAPEAALDAAMDDALAAEPPAGPVRPRPRRQAALVEVAGDGEG